MVVMVSERFKANRTLGLVRLWRFLEAHAHWDARETRLRSHTSHVAEPPSLVCDLRFI